MKLSMPMTALAFCAAAAIVALPLAARSASEPETHSHHAGGPPVYDTAAEKTVTGKVAGLLPQACACGGLHVKLETADGNLEVGLGPSAFLDGMGAKVAVGDELEITGAQPKQEAPAEFLARTVKRGESTWELRNADGTPRWTAPAGGCPMHRRGATAG